MDLNTMSKLVFALVIVGASAACAVGDVTVSAEVKPDPRPANIAWTLGDALCEPETVLPLPDDTFLVSNVCDFRTTDDGYLMHLGASGQVLDTAIVDGLDSPLGMTLNADRIHIVDANTIKTFDWPSFTFVGEVALSTRVANDVAADRDGTLYISDTAAGAVTVLAKDGATRPLETDIDLEGANGMAYGPDGFLYVGGTHLWRVDIGTGATERVGPNWLNDIDGIEFEPSGTIQVTPVGGPLIRLLPDDRVEIYSADGLSGTNHGYAPGLGLALIPTGFDNTIIAIRIE